MEQTAPIDSAQNARSVREDTAELASYALSDRASAHSTSPPRRCAQIHLESYFANGSDKSPGTSVLSNMLRRSPPSTSSPQQEGEAVGKPVEDDNDIETSSNRGRLITIPNGVREDERTPLLGKDPIENRQHPDWIHGEQDLERQERKRRKSWPKLRNVVLRSKEKSLDIASNFLNPKSWDKKIIWKNAVVAPVGYLPAVILGLLLNILDALSYGMFNSRAGIAFPRPQSRSGLQIYNWMLWSH
jgi:sulfate permease, SulP family